MRVRTAIKSRCRCVQCNELCDVTSHGAVAGGSLVDPRITLNLTPTLNLPSSIAFFDKNWIKRKAPSRPQTPCFLKPLDSPGRFLIKICLPQKDSRSQPHHFNAGTRSRTMQARFKNCWLAAKGALTVPAWLPWLLPLKADNMQVVSQSLRKMR